MSPEPRPTTSRILYDCIVIGAGHAASCAALSAVQHGCDPERVLLLEKAPLEWAGGNGYFTAGAHRTVHDGLLDLLPIVHNAPADAERFIDMEPYTTQQFTDDIMRLSGSKSDPLLVECFVRNSRDAIEWLARNVGVRFIFSFHRQAYHVNGRQKFWGGMVLGVEDGGKGLIADHHHALTKAGIVTWYDSPGIQLVQENDRVVGVVARKGNDTEVELRSAAVILASGGFESSKELREKFLGNQWAIAKVRGTPYNTGDGILMAQRVGAKITGDWSSHGAHSTCWDASAPSTCGDRLLSNQFTKSGYPLGIMVNALGQRFVDEGLDFRNYTYAKFGREILTQVDGVAWQIWDNKIVGAGWLRKEEYGDDVVKKIVARDLEEFAEMLEKDGLRDKMVFLDSLQQYNHAVSLNRKEHPELEWDPATKDGLSTHSSTLSSGLQVPKSNWALPISEPPFTAVKVTCGITFTFGGLAVDPETAGVISEATNEPIPGLFCTGEILGGLFYDNYPGGSGLTAGAVFGIKAGKEAAKLAKSRSESVLSPGTECVQNEK